MSNLNKYYRAFKNYRKETIDNNVCERDRLAIAQSNVESDILNSTKYLCHIDEDWVIAIEEGLEFVEKAVAEERQFIRTNGEVVEIEKVKKISKDSVSHLARHSEMITHVPDDPDATIVPDKLYMVEKLSDYAVYENRFLYMMLCYLRDFINYRLEKIEKLRSSYIGNFEIKKEVVSKKRKLVLETRIVEERQDNPFPIPDNESASMIQRIKDCHQIVMALLNTDLMSQVSKSPMIKPPITKTNVLKMNNNFKRSLALYDYIASYRGEGFTSEEVNVDLTPFSDKMADEIAESLNLPAFIAYKYGNNIEEYLEAEYQKEERELREQEALRLQDKIKRLKKRALESNKTLEEYMLLLEERNKMLEKDSEELTALRYEVDKLNEKINELNLEKEELERRITKLEEIIEEKIKEIAMLNQKYIDDIAALKNEHKIEIERLNKEHEANILDIKEEQALQRAQLMESYENQINELTEELTSFKAEHQEAIEDYDNQVLILNEKIKDLNSKQKQLVNDYEVKLEKLENSYIEQMSEQEALHNTKIYEMTEENILLSSQLDANRTLRGVLNPNREMTTKEKFNNLEKEYNSFKKFYKKQWKLTKKEIRKKILGKGAEEVEESAFNDPEVENLINEQLLNKALEKAKQEGYVVVLENEIKVRGKVVDKDVVSEERTIETIVVDDATELDDLPEKEVIVDELQEDVKEETFEEESTIEEVYEEESSINTEQEIESEKEESLATDQEEPLEEALADDKHEIEPVIEEPLVAEEPSTKNNVTEKEPEEKPEGKVAFKLSKKKSADKPVIRSVVDDEALEHHIAFGLPVMKLAKAKKPTKEDLVEISSLDKLQENIDNALPVLKVKKAKDKANAPKYISEEQEVVKFSLKKSGKQPLKEEKLTKFSLSKKKPQIIEKEEE